MADELDPLLHQPARARIMAYLFRNRQAAFTQVRDALGLTSGNLQSHAARLEAAGYLQSRRVLARGFEVRYFITETGASAFRHYAARLHELLALSGVEDERP